MIKLKIAQMREQLGLGEYDGNLDKLKMNIMLLKSRVGHPKEPPRKEPEIKTEQPQPRSFNDKLLSMKRNK